MVGVQMGEKNIGMVHGDAKLPQPQQQGVPAVRLAKARVNEQVAGAGDHLGVEIFQRIIGQGHCNGIKPRINFRYHKTTPFPRWALH